ncbi:polysaccharide biosynthesis/export family protein [Prosthecobacter sp.]|uniref:polysaccharide biosynthesis/export family protein n=1 Tax=Prosthecobacter sp. TaxID=1965333 RepID=UPI0037830862
MPGPMNKHASVLVSALLCFALTGCSPYEEHEAKVTTRMIERLQDQKAYRVTGVVMKPGDYPVDGSKEIKVSQAIAQAGGFAQFANKRRIILRRGTGNYMQRLFVSLDKKRPVMTLTPDPAIRAGDVIIVEEIILTF